MADFIRLKESNTLKIEIQDYNGVPTGEYLEFDTEDIELLLKYQECLEQHKKNINYVKMQSAVIEKKEDKKGKKLLSANEEAKIELVKEFYKREMEAMDLFLGENGCQKLLNGRKPYMTMFDDINEIIQPILPELELSFDGIQNKIKSKYAVKEDNVLE